MEANDKVTVISRKAASSIGATRYFTGLHCANGHIAERYVNNSACVECAAERGRLWRAENPEKAQAARDLWASNNPEKDAESKRAYSRRAYTANADVMRARGQKWRAENRDETNARRRQKRLENIYEYREKDRQWRLLNPEKLKKTRQKSYEKLRNNPANRLNASMAAGIRISIEKGSKAKRKWERLVGYTIADLVLHLEMQFDPGMNWENYGADGWEIDHIIPLSAHNFRSADDLDFRRAWALNNLQPLWQSENRSKNKRLSAPFQPSLAFGSPANDNRKSEESS